MPQRHALVAPRCGGVCVKGNGVNLDHRLRVPILSSGACTLCTGGRGPHLRLLHWSEVGQFLGEWVTASLTIGAQWEDDDKQRTRLLLEAQQLDSEVGRVEVVLVGNHLCVSPSALERTDTVGLVITTLMSVYFFRRFADSQWFTVSPSARHGRCRSHLIARFPRLCEAQTHVWGYYLF